MCLLVIPIEKDSSVNDEVNKFRHSATSALLGNNIGLSCIYGLEFAQGIADSVVGLRPGLKFLVIAE